MSLTTPPPPRGFTTLRVFGGVDCLTGGAVLVFGADLTTGALRVGVVARGCAVRFGTVALGVGFLSPMVSLQAFSPELSLGTALRCVEGA